MSQENKFKNTLREYYENKQFSYDENEWERALIQINDAKRGRRNRRAIYYTASVILVFILGIIAVLSLKSENRINSNTLTVKNPKSSISSPIKGIQTPNVPESTKKIDLKSSKQNSVESKLENQQSSNSIKLSKKPNELIPKEHAVTVISNENEETQGIRKATLTTSKIFYDSTLTPILNSNIASVVTSPALNNHINNIPIHENSGNEIKNTSTDENKNQIENQTLVSSEKTSLQTESLTPIESKNLTLIETASNKSDSTSKNTPSLNESQVFVSDSVLVKSEALTVDTLLESNTQNRLSREGIYYEIGLAWLNGWNSPVKGEARGFSPVVGIHYMNSFNNRFSLSFGVQYLLVHNFSASSKTSRVSEYGYGEQSRVTVITPTAAHYLVAPLRLHYYLDSKNSFGVGVHLAYLLTVDAKVESYDEQPGYTGNFESTQLSGYTEGFSWFDSQLTCFYRRNFLTNFAVHTELFFGLTDVKQNNFFGIDSYERNSGFKLTLIYYSSRKN